MSLFSSLSLSSLEALAALLLLDSDDLDNIVSEEIEEVKKVLKLAEEQKLALKTCAFRIKEEVKEKFLKEKSTPQNKKRKLSEINSSINGHDEKSKIYGYW